MRLLLQVLISGITVGSIYAVLAAAFGLVYNSTGAINFAQGEYLMIGGLTAAFVHETTHASVWLCMIVGFAVCGAIGVLTEVICIRPLRSVTGDTITIVTIGLAIALKAIAMSVTNRKYYSVPPWAGTAHWRLGGAVMGINTVINVVLMVVVAAVLAWFLHSTRKGLHLRAASDDAPMLGVFGVSARSTTRWAFGIAAVIGCAAGIATASISPISFDSGTLLGLKGFAAAMLGGLGSMRGAIAGGITVGILEAAATGYWTGTYADAVAFIVLVLVLVLRPTGFLGRAAMERV